jgi:thioredoxin-related protein
MEKRFTGVITIALSFLIMSFGWRTDFEKAKSDARADHKLILLKFSGSDWCLPCIRMEKEVFSKDTFTRFAARSLEMVNADFPRLKKHEVSKDVAKQNDALAAQYDKEGHFPFVLLLDADGRVLKTWDGYQGQKPETLISQIEIYVSARRKSFN